MEGEIEKGTNQRQRFFLGKTSSRTRRRRASVGWTSSTGRGTTKARRGTVDHFKRVQRTLTVCFGQFKDARREKMEAEKRKKEEEKKKRQAMAGVVPVGQGGKNFVIPDKVGEIPFSKISLLLQHGLILVDCLGRGWSEFYGAEIR